MRGFELLTLRNGRMLLLASLCMRLGTAVFGFAVPWLLLEAGSSAAVAGLAASLLIVPTLLLSFPAGVWADRAPRRRLLRIACLPTALACCLALLPAAQPVPLSGLLGLALLLGCATSLVAAAVYSSVRQVVGLERLPGAMSLMTVSGQVGIWGGPALGGLLYGLGQADALLWGLAGLVVVAGLACSRLSEPLDPPRVSESVGEAFAASLRAMGERGPVRALLLGGFWWNVLLGAPYALLVAMLHSRLDLSASATAAVLAVGACGSLSAGVAFPLLTRRWSVAYLLPRAMALQALFVLLMGLVPSAFAAGACYFAMMLLNTSVASALLAARAATAEPERQGAVASGGMIIHIIGYLLGGLLGAGLVVWLPLWAVWALGGLGVAAVALWMQRVWQPAALAVRQRSARDLLADTERDV